MGLGDQGACDCVDVYLWRLFCFVGVLITWMVSQGDGRRGEDTTAAAFNCEVRHDLIPHPEKLVPKPHPKARNWNLIKACIQSLSHFHFSVPLLPQSHTAIHTLGKNLPPPEAKRARQHLFPPLPLSSLGLLVCYHPHRHLANHTYTYTHTHTYKNTERPWRERVKKKRTAAIIS